MSKMEQSKIISRGSVSLAACYDVIVAVVVFDGTSVSTPKSDEVLLLEEFTLELL